jgi:hypothetical protein
MQRMGILNTVVILLAAMVAPLPQQGRRPPANSPWAGANRNWRKPDSKKFDCLPKDVALKDIVSYGRREDQNVSVEKKLIAIKAHCRNGKLVDARNKEIRFFRVSCWGNPPVDYLEIERREQDEIKKLQKRFTVITMGCNPMLQ